MLNIKCLLIFQDAVADAANLCLHYYCAAPEVEISEFNGKLSSLKLSFYMNACNCIYKNRFIP